MTISGTARTSAAISSPPHHATRCGDQKADGAVARGLNGLGALCWLAAGALLVPALLLCARAGGRGGAITG